MGSLCSPPPYTAVPLRLLGQSAPVVLPLGSSLQAPFQARDVEAELLGGFSQSLSSSQDGAEASSHRPSELWAGSYLFPLFPIPPHLCSLPLPALACPPNSRYTLCAKLCPDTCHSEFSGMACQNRCVEGCECNPGFVLSGLQCVPRSECGCLDPTAGYFKVSRWGWASLSPAARRHSSEL